jgi:acylphosphatase
MTMNMNGGAQVRPFDGRFHGTVAADGQTVRVAALAANHDDGLVMVSLVGYDTSVSAALAKIWKGDAVGFLPSQEDKWTGVTSLKRMAEVNYRQFAAPLVGTREKHLVALPYTAHIADGIAIPPEIPAEAKKGAGQGDEGEGEGEGEGEKQPVLKLDQDVKPRFLLANAGEETPNPRNFLFHLVGLRVILLRKGSQAAVSQWGNHLWEQGNREGLITPVPALGIQCWKLTGNIVRWNDLVLAGVRSGQLPIA